jgi:hypothetical protein
MKTASDYDNAKYFAIRAVLKHLASAKENEASQLFPTHCKECDEEVLCFEVGVMFLPDNFALVYRARVFEPENDVWDVEHLITGTVANLTPITLYELPQIFSQKDLAKYNLSQIDKILGLS